MKSDVADIEGRLRATYRAVATTTVVGVEDRDTRPLPFPGLATSPGRPRPRCLVPAMVTLVLLMAAGTVVLRESRTDGSGTRKIATAPTTPAATPTRPLPTTTAGRPLTCGSQLPRPLDLPDGYTGPQRLVSPVDGQLALEWTSASGSIVARWPSDPQYREIFGAAAPTPDAQPGVASAGTVDARQTGGGSYARTIVFGLVNVAPECRTIQVDVVDADAARADAVLTRLSGKGLFVSNVPLVSASEERPVAPTVVGCHAPAGVTAPSNRGGPVGDAAVYPSPTAALSALLDAVPTLIPNQYLEVRLPDGSFAYARDQPKRPGSFVTVIHVVRAGGGWSVGHWEASGC